MILFSTSSSAQGQLTPADRRATVGLQHAGAWSSQSSACLQVLSQVKLHFNCFRCPLLAGPVIIVLDSVKSTLEVVNKEVPPPSVHANCSSKVWDFLTQCKC